MTDKKEEKEINLYKITKEDLNLSFEGITQVEKRFLNFVRQFRSQFWLQLKVAEFFDEALTEMVDMSVKDVAIHTLYDEIKGGLKQDEATEAFTEILDSVESTDELMEEMTSDWDRMIKETIYGDLVELPKDIEQEIIGLDK